MRARHILSCLTMALLTSLLCAEQTELADESPSDEKAAESSKQNDDQLQQMVLELQKGVQAYEAAINKHTDDQKIARLLPAVARIELLQARLQADPKQAEILRTGAHAHLKWARDLTQAELTQARKLVNSFPKFIDPDKEPDKLAQRRRTEASVMSLELQLATLKELDALSFPAGSDAQREVLKQAANDLAIFYRKHRVHVAGLHARLAQARCQQALGDHTAAQGILNELISLGAAQKQPAIRRVHNQALQILLTSINDHQRDRTTVITRGNEWFQSASREERLTEAGAGIAWEVAHAMWHDGRQPEVNEAGVPSNILLRRAQPATARETFWFTLHVLRDIRATNSQHAADATRWQRELAELLK